MQRVLLHFDYQGLDTRFLDTLPTGQPAVRQAGRQVARQDSLLQAHSPVLCLDTKSLDTIF